MKGDNKIAIPWYKRTVSYNDIDVIYNNPDFNYNIPKPKPRPTPAPPRPKPVPVPRAVPVTAPQPVTAPSPNPIPVTLPQVQPSPFPIPDTAPVLKPVPFPRKEPNTENNPLKNPNPIPQLKPYERPTLQPLRGYGEKLQPNTNPTWINDVITTIMDKDITVDTIALAKYLNSYDYDNFKFNNMFKDLTPEYGNVVALFVTIAITNALISRSVITTPARILTLTPLNADMVNKESGRVY